VREENRLKVSEDRVQKIKFRPNRFIILFFTKYYYGDQIKEDKMDSTPRS
jgi:hypothetical protein